MKRILVLAAITVLTAAAGFALAACGTTGAQSAGDVPSADAAAGAEAAPSEQTESGSATLTAPPPTTATATATGSGEGPAKVTLEVWFVKPGGELKVVHVTRPATPRVATAALEALLDGPKNPVLATAIPFDAQLLGVRVAHGVATANFTSEYESGGGELSMQLRLAQVVYTLTQFPTVRGVRFELDGQPINVFSSEGIVLDHPVGREDYNDLVPAIVVTSPTPGETTGNPMRVTGTANVFEANVGIQVLDVKGRTVGETFTTASCGTGCRGTYSALVSYEVDKKQHGTLVVHDDDADGDGRWQHEVRVYVTLVPK